MSANSHFLLYHLVKNSQENSILIFLKSVPGLRKQNLFIIAKLCYTILKSFLGVFMKFFRDLKTDYLESRFSAYESFAEWFLKRKLGFWGKIMFAYLLWLVWIFFFSHPHYIIFFFYGVILLSLFVMLVEWWKFRK